MICISIALAAFIVPCAFAADDRRPNPADTPIPSELDDDSNWIDVPDITGDEVPDLLVLDPDFDDGRGRLCVVSGPDARSRATTPDLPPDNFVFSSDCSWSAFPIEAKAARDIDADGTHHVWVLCREGASAGAEEYFYLAIDFQGDSPKLLDVQSLGSTDHLLYWDALPEPDDESPVKPLPPSRFPNAPDASQLPDSKGDH